MAKLDLSCRRSARRRLGTTLERYLEEGDTRPHFPDVAPRSGGPQFTGRQAESSQPKQTEIQRSTRSFEQIRLERLRSTVAVIGDRDVLVPLAKAGELYVFLLATVPFPRILPLGLVGKSHPAEAGPAMPRMDKKQKAMRNVLFLFQVFDNDRKWRFRMPLDCCPDPRKEESREARKACNQLTNRTSFTAPRLSRDYLFRKGFRK